MRLLLFTLTILMLSQTVLAEEAQSALCKVLPAHVPQADVAYVGDATVPADLNPIATPIATPIYDPVVIPVEVDLIDRFNLNVPAGIKLKPEVASVKIYQDGRVDYNGQDITDQAHELCNLEAKVQKSNGQQGEDELISDPAVDVKPLTAKVIDGSIILEGESE